MRPLLTVLLAALAGCAAHPVAPAPALARVGIVVLKAAPLTLSDELTGRVAPTQASDVRPQVSGIVRARLFAEGAQVHAGQPLYEIDPSLYRTAQDQAAAQLETAQSTLLAAQSKADRFKALTDTDAASRQDVDDAAAAATLARASVHQFQAALQTARINLGYTRLTAPISGRIGRSAITAGALVTAGQATPLATIQALDPVYVDITQSASQRLSMRRAAAAGQAPPAGAAVRLKLEDGGDYPLPGRLEFSEVSVDPDSGTVILRARFPNPQGLLLPGMFVRVELAQASVPRAILAPQQAVSRGPDGDATALVLDARDRVVSRRLQVGPAVGDRWLVTSGLSAGDRLIVEGVAKVKPGDVVSPFALRQDG